VTTASARRVPRSAAKAAGTRRSSAKPTPESDHSERPPSLDNLTLARKEGWRAFVEAPRRPPPESLSRTKLQALTAAARSEYDRQRRIWHANLPTIRTTQFSEIYETLWDILDSNMQDGDKAKSAVGIEGPAGIGKSICVQEFGREFHRREIAELGEYTSEGNERWPVCRVGMTGNTGMKEFNRGLLGFYNHAATKRGTAAQFADRALDCVLSCETRLLIVDDLHFLRQRTTSTEISNQFKYISNEFPLTIIFVGIGLRARGLYSDGTTPADNAAAVRRRRSAHPPIGREEGILGQTGRRTTALTMREFSIDDDEHRLEWRKLLLSIEKQLVLADKHIGMLADDLSDYLYARSSGRIGSLTTLIARGCQRATRSGHEKLDRELLDAVPNDAASEAIRPDLQVAFDAHRLVSKPTKNRHPRSAGRS
jgi:hypothetical protein